MACSRRSRVNAARGLSRRACQKSRRRCRDGDISQLGRPGRARLVRHVSPYQNRHSWTFSRRNFLHSGRRRAAFPTGRSTKARETLRRTWRLFSSRYRRARVEFLLDFGDAACLVGRQIGNRRIGPGERFSQEGRHLTEMKTAILQRLAPSLSNHARPRWKDPEMMLVEAVAPIVSTSTAPHLPRKTAKNSQLLR